MGRRTCAKGIEFQRLDLEGLVTANIALSYVKFAFFVPCSIPAIVATVSVLRSQTRSVYILVSSTALSLLKTSQSVILRGVWER